MKQKMFIFFVNVKVKLSPSKKNLCHLLQRKPFKNDEKYFLFHTSSFYNEKVTAALLCT